MATALATTATAARELRYLEPPYGPPQHEHKKIHEYRAKNTPVLLKWLRVLLSERDGRRKQPRASTSSSSTLSCARSFNYHPFIMCFGSETIAKAEERVDACLCVQSGQNGLGDRIELRVVRLRLVDHVGLLGPMEGSTEAAAAPRAAPRRPRVGCQLPHEATAEGILSSFFVDAFERFSSLRSAPRRLVY